MAVATIIQCPPDSINPNPVADGFEIILVDPVPARRENILVDRLDYERRCEP